MDTWGISGGDFLALYAAAGAAVFAGAYRLRGRAVRDRDESPSPPRLDDYEVAMLNGGPELVVAAAAANLHDAGTLVVRGYDRALSVAHMLQPGAAAVERRVHDAIRGEPAEDRRRLAALEKDPTVERIRDRLLELGLLASRRQRMLARLPALCLLPVVALGAARIAAGSAAGKPVVYITILTIAAACAAAGLAVAPPRHTASGRRALARLRDLEPSGAASTLGGTIAVSGLPGLWRADATLATALGLPPESAGAGRIGVWGGWGCGGCGAGGGCGGGGCGG